MPKSSAYSSLVLTATSLHSSRNLPVSSIPYLRVLVISLSIIPVRETPKSLSCSVFFFQSEDRNWKFVYVLCMVPSIVASLIFLFISSSLSVLRTITSVKFSYIHYRSLICSRDMFKNPLCK